MNINYGDKVRVTSISEDDNDVDLRIGDTATVVEEFAGILEDSCTVLLDRDTKGLWSRYYMLNFDQIEIITE